MYICDKTFVFNNQREGNSEEKNLLGIDKYLNYLLRRFGRIKSLII